MRTYKLFLNHIPSCSIQTNTQTISKHQISLFSLNSSIHSVFSCLVAPFTVRIVTKSSSVPSGMLSINPLFLTHISWNEAAKQVTGVPRSFNIISAFSTALVTNLKYLFITTLIHIYVGGITYLNSSVSFCFIVGNFRNRFFNECRSRSSCWAAISFTRLQRVTVSRNRGKNIIANRSQKFR